LSVSSFVAIIVLATIEGGLVALARADALEALRRLRSPAWSALLPGSIVVGTFAPLALPSMARGLVLLAAIATPLLAVVAILAVVRGPSTCAGCGRGRARGCGRARQWLAGTDI
jgi:hypothetical protein